MLSKGEVQYHQGHKVVSKSYERKLRCIIRKKLEILQNEFPLLSKLFVNEVNTFLNDQTSHALIQIKEGNEWLEESGQELAINHSAATVFGNTNVNYIKQVKIRKLEDRESIEGSKTSNPAPKEATEFSNFSKEEAPGEGFEQNSLFMPD